MQGKLWAYKGLFLSGNLLSHSSSWVEPPEFASGSEDFGRKRGFLEEIERGNKIGGNLKVCLKVTDEQDEEEAAGGERKEKVSLLPLRVLEKEHEDEMDNIFD